MMKTFLRRARLGVRLLFLTPAERAYVRKIRRSQLFDRHFYLTTNPHMHPLTRMFPERHYVQFGEVAGLRPNPEFAPLAYLRHNADLTGSVTRPFLHYIDHGRHEQRITKDLPLVEEFDLTPVPVLRPVDFPAKPARFAVLVHVYYHDLWDEIARYLERQTIPFDLFVTVVRFKRKSDVESRIKQAFPDAVLLGVPNHGRDIFPFVHLVNAGAFAPYEAVCKIHTKKSPHRQDGDVWRNHLIKGVLDDPEITRRRLEAFLADPEAAFWVADGQIYDGTRWWGSNTGKTAHLLQRVEIQMDAGTLRFPAGSMYWVKPLMLDMIRGMRLTYGDFEEESSQVDGTTAHAMERALGYLAHAAGQQPRQASELDKPRDVTRRATRPSFVSAFYLPQFHPVPENDLWWGKGFTEWRSVVDARPVFVGHGQPALPADLGFYDLRVPETLAAQAAMARDCGIDAFCVYHYWFDGKRMLERPMETLLERNDIEFPFYLCWANESWRRNWDGLSGEILLDQSYRPGFAAALAKDLVRFFADPRYARPDGRRPRFVIYRPEDMPEPAANVAEMRRIWTEAGIGDVELGAVRFHVKGRHPVPESVFDFWVEMPPHGLVEADDYLFGGPGGNRLNFTPEPGFEGLIYDYRAVARRAATRGHAKRLPQNTIAGVMPGWDNTARRGLSAHIAYGANPAAFAYWLRQLSIDRLDRSYRGELFLNAWNEWAEKAMLEPSRQWGDAYLKVLAAHCTEKARRPSAAA
ncbi:glycoside hydrolase family 99-like domain-containing protein [Rhodosalinus sp. K401]|uniref:glycoside hydrolase family 99-like domain-containing protein n=1 Tax=Rhodosalinus sp. K401 TaxID=3239195 RepID=UPI0035232911